MKRLAIAKKKCLYIKYHLDTRYSEKSISTHDGQRVDAVKCDTLMDLKKLVNEYECIGIDEGQFVRRI
jgi:thymidine kinase